MKIVKPAAALAVALAAIAGGQGAAPERTASCVLPRGSEKVSIDPATFTTRIDNPWWPMRPGSRWLYRETDAGRDEAARRRHGQHDRRSGSRTASRQGSCTTSVTEDGEPGRGHGRLVRAGRAAGTSGTSARTRRSTRTARSSRRRAPWRPGSTARCRAWSCPRGPGPACATARSTTRGTRRTAPRSSAGRAGRGAVRLLPQGHARDDAGS